MHINKYLKLIIINGHVVIFVKATLGVTFDHSLFLSVHYPGGRGGTLGSKYFVEIFD